MAWKSLQSAPGGPGCIQGHGIAYEVCNGGYVQQLNMTNSQGFRIQTATPSDLSHIRLYIARFVRKPLWRTCNQLQDVACPYQSAAMRPNRGS